MKINYNLTGAGRKALVAAISQELDTSANYLGVPTFAFKVGEYNISKTGMVSGPDNHELIADLQGLHSLVPESEEYDKPITMPEHPKYETLPLTEREELGLGQECRENWQGENGMQASDVPTQPQDIDTLTIEIPKDGFTETAVANLHKLVNSKTGLIKKAIGTEMLTIEETAETLKFPWFPANAEPEAVKAYSHFVTALGKMAREQKRITATERPIENAKYAFRCFLLRLGFIGEEYKTERKILLSNLSGSGSFKNGQRKQQENNASTVEIVTSVGVLDNRTLKEESA